MACSLDIFVKCYLLFHSLLGMWNQSQCVPLESQQYSLSKENIHLKAKADISTISDIQLIVEKNAPHAKMV